MFFFFNDTATTEIYTLSLHDALPICEGPDVIASAGKKRRRIQAEPEDVPEGNQAHEGGSVENLGSIDTRSEEHTSELQSRQYLVCRLLLEKKKNNHNFIYSYHSSPRI